MSTFQRSRLNSTSVLPTTFTRHPSGLSKPLLCAALTAILLLPASSTFAAKLYWSDMRSENVKRADLDGSNVEVVLHLPGLAYMVPSVEYGKIFLTEGSPVPQLWSADLDGANLQLLSTFDIANYTRGINVSPATGKLYWSSSHGYEAGNGKIRTANVDGTGVADLLDLGVKYPYGLAIDHEAGKAYWAISGDDERIERSNLDGTDWETIYNGPVGWTSSIAVDSVSDRMFFDNGSGHIVSTNYSGGDLQTIGPLGSWGDGWITVDETARRIYWNDQEHDLVYSAGLDGSDLRIILGPEESTLFLGAMYIIAPEPSTFALAGLACAALLVARRRSRMHN